MKPEDVIADPTRPFTGAEYLQSLRDGREVYIDGQRVADVTTHPALRNAARSIARLYDALHDPKHHDLLTCPTDTVLLPQMTIKEAVAMFENAESDALAVVDSAEARQVIGLLTEQYALRRYSEELDRRRRELSGE